MRRYTHLTAGERDRIAEMRASGSGVREIAREIGRSESTVSRELARNGRGGRYGAIAAQRRADARRAACRPARRLDDPTLAGRVRRLIEEDRWSPEQVDGRLRLEAGGRCVVSLSTIYRAVARGDLDLPGREPVRRLLRRRGRRPRRGRAEARGRIRVQHELSERPAEAGARSRLGDWEADTVVGPGGACLVTLVDRASRLLVGGRSAGRSCSEVGDALVAALSGRPRETVTPDRGKEFANNDEVSGRLGGVQFYFCQAHHPWEKGTNENTNGLLREFFPKGTDFSKVSDEEVERAYGLINDRPRKVLGYRTANEVYREMLHSA